MFVVCLVQENFSQPVTACMVWANGVPEGESQYAKIQPERVPLKKLAAQTEFVWKDKLSVLLFHVVRTCKILFLVPVHQTGEICESRPRLQDQIPCWIVGIDKCRIFRTWARQTHITS